MTWRSQWSVFWCSSNRLQKKESHYQSIYFMLEAAAAKMTEESSKFSNSEWRWKSHWLGGFYFPFSSIAKMATIFFYKFSYANAVTHLLQNENGTSLSLQLKTVLVCDCTCRSRCDGFQFAFTFVFTHGDWVLKKQKPVGKWRVTGLFLRNLWWVGKLLPSLTYALCLTFHSLRFVSRFYSPTRCSRGKWRDVV